MTASADLADGGEVAQVAQQAGAIDAAHARSSMGGLFACHQAMQEHAEEGGVAARGARYQKNAQILIKGMRDMGFSTLLSDNEAGPIIQTFLTPRDKNFHFENFYEDLRRRGFAIYPGKLTKRSSFRIGTIGKVDEAVMHGVLKAIREVLAEMKVTDLTPLE